MARVGPASPRERGNGPAPGSRRRVDGTNESFWREPRIGSLEWVGDPVHRRLFHQYGELHGAITDSVMPPLPPETMEVGQRHQRAAKPARTLGRLIVAAENEYSQ